MDRQKKSIIEDLLETPFLKRSFEEQRLVMQKGRPCPKLSDLKSVHKDSKKQYTRMFKENQYTLYPWLAGCEKRVKLFCWPCLLFSVTKSAWNCSGLQNLNSLQILQKKHKQSVTHMQCVLKLTAFSKKITENDLRTQSTLNSQHNQQVKKNREVLKRLIDVVCFLAKEELTVIENYESISSLERGNYTRLLNFFKIYEPAFTEHFQTASTFSTSMTILKDLIKAIGELVHSNINKQLEQSEFVTIMWDEPIDIEMKTQLSVVLRYYSKGNIYETFVGFIDVSSGRSADDLFTSVKTILQKYNLVKKLVALTYDGAVVMGSQSNSLQTKVRELCPKALTIHSYAHILNLVLSQGLSSIKECRLFFSHLYGIANFTSNSNKRSYVLREYLTRKIPSLATTKWCFSSRLVNVVHMYRETIAQFFDSIQKDDNSVWESKDRMAAFGYRKFLEGFETFFLLNMFSKLFAHSDILFDFLRMQNTNIHVLVNQVTKLRHYLKVQREEGFPEIWESTLTSQISVHVQMKEQIDSNNEDKYKELFKEIIDNLVVQISERFSSLENLQYLDLLNGNHFNEYAEFKVDFTENIQKLTELYPNTFDYNLLKTELTILYANSQDIELDFLRASSKNKDVEQTRTKDITPYDVLCYIEKNGIATTFDQTYKLSKLICTIPLVVPIANPALTRIKEYVRNTQGQERDGMALLSIEKAMLGELQKSDGFYYWIIESFLSLEKREYFIYK